LRDESTIFDRARTKAISLSLSPFVFFSSLSKINFLLRVSRRSVLAIMRILGISVCGKMVFGIVYMIKNGLVILYAEWKILVT